MRDIESLAKRISELEERLFELSNYLRASLNYAPSDPQSSLTKCRIILEKILTNVYLQEMLKVPSGTMVGNIMSDKGFVAKLPRRMVARINSIRDMANLGPHGGDVESEDAVRVIEDLVDVLEWFVRNYDASTFQEAQLANGFAQAQTVEILPQLQSSYRAHLRPNILSVKFGQSSDRCFLQVITFEDKHGLYNEMMRREDLGYIMSGPEDLYFKPSQSIYDNARKFVEEFDEIAIINCTDLFTEEAATMIYNYWAEHGVTPSGKK